MTTIFCFAVTCIHCVDNCCELDEMYINWDQVTDRRPSCTDYEEGDKE